MTAQVETDSRPVARMVFQARVDEIVNHPSNPRFSLEELNADGLLDSVKRHGVLVPVMLVKQEEGGYRLRMGHRRTQCAREAGLEFVPAMAVDSESEAEEISQMLAENDNRTNLSPMERATAYQRVLDLVGSEKKAAAVLGVSQKQIKAHVPLTKLPNPVKEKVHSGQLTLDQAAAVGELSDDEAAVAELVEAAGSPNFNHRLEHLRQERERQRAADEIVKQIEADGTRCLGRWDGGVPEGAAFLHNLEGPNGKVMGPEDHKDCPHRAVFVQIYWSYLAGEKTTYRVMEVCTDWQAAGHKIAAGRGMRTAEDEERDRKYREKLEREEADRAAARKVRRDFLAEVKITPALQTSILRSYLLNLLPNYLEAHENYSSRTTSREDIEDLARIFGVEIPLPPAKSQRPSQAQRDRELAAMRASFPLFKPAVKKASAAVLAKGLLSVLRRNFEYEWEHTYALDPTPAVEYATFLQEAGYQLSTGEKKVLADHQRRLQEHEDFVHRQAEDARKAQEAADKKDAEKKAKAKAARAAKKNATLEHTDAKGQPVG